MKHTLKSVVVCLGLLVSSFSAVAQVDTTAAEEEDFSIYDNLDYAGGGTKRFANAKISGLSPARLISVGYDFQGSYNITAGAVGSFAEQTAKVNNTQGLRIGANIPVISKNNIIIQLGGQIWDVNYSFNEPDKLTHPMLQALSENSLTTAGLNSTIYSHSMKNHSF